MFDFEKIKDDNYLIFFMLSNNYIEKQYGGINKTFHLINTTFRYLLKLGLNIYMYFTQWHYKKDIKQKIIFFNVSKNNYDALYSTYSKLSNDSLMLTTDYKLRDTNILLPKLFPQIISFLFIPMIIYQMIVSERMTKKKIILYFDDILLSFGYRIFIKYYVNYLNPKSIVYTNDHTFYGRSLVNYAESIDIPCFYMQHSAITNIFPPIYASYALLEGKDSCCKYNVDYNNNDNIALIGSPKFDQYYHQINYNRKVDTIGLCSTLSMDKEEMIDFIKLLQNKFPHENIYFRPHPTEIRIKKYYNFIKSSQINISNSLSEDSFQFLKKVDVVISGNSSILLEAALLNIYPIYWNSILSESKYNDKPDDKYGFVEGGIAHSVDSKEDIVGLLNDLHIEKPNIRNKTKLYCDTVGTKWDGKSTDLAVQIISNKIGLNYKE